jgi:transposase
MKQYPAVAVERAMKVQEVFMQARAKKITWMEAAEILGVTDRTMRRWKRRQEKYGFVLDQRWGRASDKRVSVEVIEKVLGLYRDRYFDFSVRHFHEKLASEHDIHLSYTHRLMAGVRSGSAYWQAEHRYKSRMTTRTTRSPAGRRIRVPSFITRLPPHRARKERSGKFPRWAVLRGG